jgi:hypothetical protein
VCPYSSMLSNIDMFQCCLKLTWHFPDVFFSAIWSSDRCCDLPWWEKFLNRWAQEFS